MTGPEKHSVTLRGHRTSISLEPEFWAELRSIAKHRNQAINAFIADIDATRDPQIGLASALRVYILNHVKEEQQVG